MARGFGILASGAAHRQYHISIFFQPSSFLHFYRSIRPPVVPQALRHCALKAQACIRAFPPSARASKHHYCLPRAANRAKTIVKEHSRRQPPPGLTHAGMRQPLLRFFGLWAALALLPSVLAVEDDLCFENRQLVTLGTGQQTVQASTYSEGACGGQRWGDAALALLHVGPLQPGTAALTPVRGSGWNETLGACRGGHRRRYGGTIPPTGAGHPLAFVPGALQPVPAPNCPSCSPMPQAASSPTSKTIFR